MAVGAFVLLLFCGSGALAARRSLSESADQDDKQAQAIAEIKAELLYRFSKFVEWPKSCFEKPTSPIVVGVVGRDPFGSILDKTFKEKKHGRRGFVLRRFATPDRITECHVLFVPVTEQKHMKRINEMVRGKHILMVGDWTDFARKGGIINFYLEKTKDKKGHEAVTNKFEINNEEAKRQKIKISSQLLKLARLVKDKKGKEEDKQP